MRTLCRGLLLATATLWPTVSLAVEADERTSPAPEPVFLHGFRLGYIYVNTPEPYLSAAEEAGVVVNPHYALVGYELNQRIDGGSWLNLLLVENVAVAGINQSVFRPQVNGLVGIDVNHVFELGFGVNWSPRDPRETTIHMIAAAGVTPMVGHLNVPIHLTFMPDHEGFWRGGLTVGVNWGEPLD